MDRRILLLTSVLLVACSQKRVHEDPIMQNDDIVEDASTTVDAAAARGERDRAEAAREREELTARALSDCEPRVCDAVVRGEVTTGMNRTQVLAATRTTGEAWADRSAGEATVLMPRSLERPPSDRVGEIVLVQLASGRVSRFGYREPQGMRLITSPADATPEARAVARADALVEEGDALAAAGDLAGALDRYDRASILKPADPLIDYRIATVLDKQLRPIEALIQYQLFLHRLEIEKIEARGDAAAKLADAIARARERIIILEKHGP